MEEDIKIIKKVIKHFKNNNAEKCLSGFDIKAIENILNELERLQRENHYTFLMSISCDGNCQICEHFKNEFLLETENRHLKKGINTLMNKRKKWKNRYYKLKTKNLNITRELLSRTDKLNDSIPKQVIRDKIEELNNYESKFSQRVLNHSEFTLTEFVQNILKELLGDE